MEKKIKNPRFRKPKYLMAFRVEKDTRLVLERLSAQAVPLPTGEQPSTSEVARALLDQQARKITGDAGWLRRDAITHDFAMLGAHAGYDFKEYKAPLNPYDVDWEEVEELFHTVVVSHPAHAMEAMRRGITVITLELDEIRVHHGNGLVRKFHL